MKRSNKGLTLVEALISTMLLTIVLLSAIEVFIVGEALSSIAKHKVQAIYVAERAIEDIRRKPLSLITGSTSSVTIDTNSTPDYSGDDFMGTCAITVTSPSTYYKKVIVEISWSERIAGITKTMRERCGTFVCNDY